MKSMARACAVALCLATTFASVGARADDVAAAQVLFTDGRRLMAEGNFAAACPKLEESQRLDPGAGTLYNLADCFEHQGRIASAWARFLEVAGLARNAGQADREADARQRAAAIEPRLSRLSIVVDATAPGLRVTRDEEEVGRAQWGMALPVDPGSHRVVAAAEGKQTWEGTVVVPEEGKSVSLRVPRLLDAPKPKAALPAPTPEPLPPRSNGKGQRILGLGIAGVGVVGLGLGAVFGLSSKSKHDEAEGLCAPPNGCGQEGVDKRSEAYTAGTISTVAFAVGAVAVAGGVVLWLTAPHSDGGTRVGLAGDRLVVGGAW